MAGVSLLIYYWTGLLSPGLLYFLINIPIFILGWRFVSRRFFFYSLYGMTSLTLAIDLLNFQIPVHEPMLAVLAGGALMGAGAGMILHSLGSAGGIEVAPFPKLLYCLSHICPISKVGYLAEDGISARSIGHIQNADTF